MTIIVKQIYRYICQISGEHLQDPLSSGLKSLNLAMLIFISLFDVGCCLSRIENGIYTASNRNAGRTVETPDLRCFNSGLQ